MESPRILFRRGGGGTAQESGTHGHSVSALRGEILFGGPKVARLKEIVKRPVEEDVNPPRLASGLLNKVDVGLLEPTGKFSGPREQFLAGIVDVEMGCRDQLPVLGLVPHLDLGERGDNDNRE